MRILQVTLGFYPAQAWGGPVKIVHQNSRELVKRGHKVTVYCTNLLNKKQKISPGTFEQNIDGIRVVYLDTINYSRWPGSLGPIWIPKLSATLKQEIDSFDVIHLNGYRSPLMLTSARAAQKARIPIVTQPHGTLPVIVNSLALKRIYDKTFGKMELKGVNTLIALQESERLQAIAQGIPDERIAIVPNGIDPSEKENLQQEGSFRKRFGINPLKPLILFLGRINKKKGTDMLVEAFARLGHMDAQLAIVGPDDGQLEEIKGLVQKYGLNSKVFITGLLSGSDVLGAFQDSDIFVLPCRADTFPVTILESCLMDVPMVITDRCEIAHMVKAKVAEVVPFDVQAFASSMETLLTDQERYNRYKRNCSNLVNETFSIQAVVDRLEDIYQRVATEKVN